MKIPKISIYGLNSYGLNLKKLSSMGKRPVTVHVHFKHIDEKKLFPLTPSERRKKVEEWYLNSFLAVRSKWPTKKFKTITIKKELRGIEGVVEARQVQSLNKIPQLSFISIKKIFGIKQKKPVVVAKKEWFSVVARFTIQVEGQKKGMQTYDDRTFLVKALNAKSAERILQREFKEYSQPFLNSDGYMIRWGYERILDIYQLIDEEIDPMGTEVYSVIKNRRMKPEDEWKPQTNKPNSNRKR